MISHCLWQIYIRLCSFHFFRHHLTTFTFTHLQNSYYDISRDCVIYSVSNSQKIYIQSPSNRDNFIPKSASFDFCIRSRCLSNVVSAFLNPFGSCSILSEKILWSFKKTESNCSFTSPASFCSREMGHMRVRGTDIFQNYNGCTKKTLFQK